MADDISRYGADPREESARRLREGAARRARRDMPTREQLPATSSGGRGGPPTVPPGTGVAMPDPGSPAGRSLTSPSNAPMVRPRANFDDIMRRGMADMQRPGMRGRGAGPAAAAGAAMALGPAIEEGLRERATRTMDERARTSRLDGMRRSLPAGPDAEVERLMRDMPAGPDIEAERAASRPARAAPPQQRSAPMARREMTADQLNEMVLQRLGREPFETVPETPEATGPEAAVARERIRQRMAEPYKKGGVVKPKAPVKKAAGGMIKPKVAAPAGRGKGRPPATAVKPFGTRAMAKAAGPKKPVAMPAFKKGGTVKKAKGGMIGKGCK
jgi:hypothetical protein